LLAEADSTKTKSMNAPKIQLRELRLEYVNEELGERHLAVDGLGGQTAVTSYEFPKSTSDWM
jgi:hypothetical protein